MNVALWIVAGVLAAAYLAAGGMKIARSREQLRASNMDWVDDFSETMVKAIGAVEVLGAIGLILPWATDIAPVLTPTAATGLVLVQLGAMAVHIRRKEPQVLPVNLVLLALAAFVAIGRFADLS